VKCLCRSVVAPAGGVLEGNGGDAPGGGSTLLLVAVVISVAVWLEGVGDHESSGDEEQSHPYHRQSQRPGHFERWWDLSHENNHPDETCSSSDKQNNHDSQGKAVSVYYSGAGIDEQQHDADCGHDEGDGLKCANCLELICLVCGSNTRRGACPGVAGLERPEPHLVVNDAIGGGVLHPAGGCPARDVKS